MIDDVYSCLSMTDSRLFAWSRVERINIDKQE